MKEGERKGALAGRVRPERSRCALHKDRLPPAQAGLCHQRAGGWARRRQRGGFPRAPSQALVPARLRPGPAPLFLFFPLPARRPPLPAATRARGIKCTFNSKSIILINGDSVNCNYSASIHPAAC